MSIKQDEFNKMSQSSRLDEDVDIISECNPSIFKKEKEIYVETEIFDEKDIPAEFEEEIEADECFENVATIKDHVETISAPKNLIHPRSLLIPQSEVKFKQTLTVSRSLLKSNHHTPILKFPVVKPNLSLDVQNPSKFRQTVNITKPTNFVLNEHTMKIFKNKIKAQAKRKAQAIAREKKKVPKTAKTPAHNLNKSKKNQEKKTIPFKNFIYIGPQKHKIVDPKNSGEIIRVEKGESDVEVDILSNSEEEIPLDETPHDDCNSLDTDSLEAIIFDLDKELEEKMNEIREEETYEILNSIDIHLNIVLEATTITSLERFFHSEFFANASSIKTPERYLKIRNHIVTMWQQQKPLYLSKTTARKGLKNCGDVNCIGRIFSFLEQVGAVNFNCSEAVKWIRPLKMLYKVFQQNIRNKNNSLRISRGSSMKEKHAIRHSVFLQHTNYTIQHDSIYSDSMINRIKSRTQNRTQFDLLTCQQFDSKNNPAPFTVSVSISCLLCLYFHSLSSHFEIMGFLGGKSIGREKINLTRYKPCRTSKQTAITCEMCPVSQVKQSSELMDEGFELLGWFHSHPNFPPFPSRTDLNTQSELQQQFAPNNKHFIGFILSCVDMEFKCIYMQNSEAYEIKVEVIQDFSNLNKDILDVLNVVQKNESVRQKFIETSNSLLKELSISESIEDIIKEIQVW